MQAKTEQVLKLQRPESVQCTLDHCQMENHLVSALYTDTNICEHPESNLRRKSGVCGGLEVAT